MAVSIGPYSTCIYAPVVTIQAVTTSFMMSDGRPWRVHVRMDISNEKALQGQRVGEFHNFVIISPNIEDLNMLCYNKLLLVQRIKHTKSRSPAAPLKQYQDSTSWKMAVSKLPQNAWAKKAPLGVRRPDQTTWDFSYQVAFNLKYSPTLYVLVVSYSEHKGSIDIDKMNMVKDTVLLDGLVPSTTNLYHLEETMEGFGSLGSLWPGAVHRFDGNDMIMAGEVHTIAKHPPVKLQPVTNFKNIDLRIVNASNQLQISFPPQSPAARPYASEPILSRNGDGLIHGFFSFDLYNYGRDETEFGGVLRTGESLSSATRLKDIIVYSKLAGEGMKGNSLTPGNQGEAHCGTGKVDQYKKIASLGDNLDVVSIANNGEILNIAFMDRSTVNYIQGHMQYKIEVVVVDETRHALKGILEKLTTTLSKFEGLPPHMRPQLPWPMLVNQYMAALMFIFGKEEILGFTIPYWKRNLIALTSKFNQPLLNDGYGLLLHHIRAATSQIADLLVSKVPPKTNRSGAKKSVMGASKKTPFLMMEKEFKTKFQIQGSKNVGLDYLESRLTNTFGVLPTLAYGDMAGRVEDEKQKFLVNNPNAVGVNSYGFLSPASVSLSNNFSRVSTTSLQSSTDSLSSLIRNDSNPTTKVLSPQKSVSAEHNKKTVLNSLGVTAEPYPTSLNKLVAQKNLAKSKNTDSKNMLSSGSAFTTANTQQTAASGSIESNIKASFTSAKIANSALVNTIINKQTAGFKTIKAQNLSIMAGSLAAMKLKENENITTEINAISNVLNFGSLVRVEYLASFAEPYGIMQPIWAPMTEGAHNTAEQEQETLVCRLVSLTNTINVKGNLGVKPLATLFALGPIRQSYVRGGDYNRTLKENEYESRGMVAGSNLLEDQGPLSLYARNAPLYPMPEELPPTPSKGSTRFSRRDKELKKSQACDAQQKVLRSVSEQLGELNREINSLDPAPRYWSQIPPKRRQGNEGPLPYKMYKASVDKLENLKIERANLVADVQWLQENYKACLIREEAARKAAAIAAAKAEQARRIAERKAAARKKREQEQRERERKRKQQEEARAAKERKRQQRERQRQQEAKREKEKREAARAAKAAAMAAAAQAKADKAAAAAAAAAAAPQTTMTSATSAPPASSQYPAPSTSYGTSTTSAPPATSQYPGSSGGSSGGGRYGK